MSANDDVAREIDQLKRDLSSLRADISSLTEALGQAGRERSRETLRSAKNMTGNAVDSLGSSIDDKPLTSVLTAFGTGFLIGLMLSHRSR